MKPEDKMEIAALKKIAAHLQTVAGSYEDKHQKIVKERMELLSAMDFHTENDIMDAYGWDIITEDQRDMLLEALESGVQSAEADTVWSVAARILRRDVSGYRAGIAAIQDENMTPEQRKEKEAAEAKWQAEQDERRKRLRGEYSNEK